MFGSIAVARKYIDARHYPNIVTETVNVKASGETKEQQPAIANARLHRYIIDVGLPAKRQRACQTSILAAALLASSCS